MDSVADGNHLGVVLPTGKAQWGEGTDPRDLIDFAVRAERLGYASIWAGDTLLRPVIETFTMLSAAAAATERVGLGSAALIPALRRPVQAAQAIASLDLLSGGRLTLTVGAGFPHRSETEYAVAEVPWRGRFARLDDTVALWRQLWTADGPTSYHGDVLHFDHIPEAIRPAQPGGPPIWLGGAAPAALDRAGRLYDGWLPYPPEPADYQTGLAAVRRAAIGAGRSAEAVTPALFATVLIVDDPEAGRRALAEYAQRTYRMPIEVVETIQLLVAGPPETVTAALDRYVAAGARHVVCRIGALDLKSQLDQLELISELRLSPAGAAQSTWSSQAR
ncbi:LLM class flavin-dependent oxidoreductase [Rugosimonospora africana]|nr:LLM class flavin-dependent oxidoreductase [Rugosimonospora africana]